MLTVVFLNFLSIPVILHEVPLRDILLVIILVIASLNCKFSSTGNRSKVLRDIPELETNTSFKGSLFTCSSMSTPSLSIYLITGKSSFESILVLHLLLRTTASSLVGHCMLPSNSLSKDPKSFAVLK
nr:hypothetical 13.8K protein - rice stripe virus [Tenuivirus oryzaclavatae]